MKLFDQLTTDFQIWVDTAIEYSTDNIKNQYAEKISWYSFLLAALNNSSTETQHLFSFNINSGYKLKDFEEYLRAKIDGNRISLKPLNGNDEDFDEWTYTWICNLIKLKNEKEAWKFFFENIADNLLEDDERIIDIFFDIDTLLNEFSQFESPLFCSISMETSTFPPDPPITLENLNDKRMEFNAFKKELDKGKRITKELQFKTLSKKIEECIQCGNDPRASELMDELQQMIADTKPNIIKLEQGKDDFLEKINNLKNTLFYNKDDFEKFEELLKNIDAQENIGLNAYSYNNQYELTECLIAIENLKGYIDKTAQKIVEKMKTPMMEIIPFAAKQLIVQLEELIKMCLSEVLKSEARESIYELKSIPDSFKNDEEASDHRSTLQHANELAERMKEEIKKDNKEVYEFREQKNTAKSQSPEVPTSRIDLVHFSVSSPPAVQPGKEIIVDVWAHLEQQRAEVASRVKQASIPTEAPPVIRPKGPFKIERGTMLYVRLKFQDLIVEPAEDVILWEGEIGNASFVISIPAEASEGVRIGSVTVHCEEGLQIARIPLQLMIKNEVVYCEPIEQPLHRVRKAFVSYARADLDEVLSRIQGMQKIIPDLDVFLDVVKLRSGEDWEKRLWTVIPESDVFYLFWSAAAKESLWVEKEWRCALTSRGVDFIDPVPLVSPNEVPPPEELSKMHFNDWSLAYRRSKSDITK